MNDMSRVERKVKQDDIKITARDVQVYYGDKHAIKDVNVDILDKTVTAFIGPSGCGKSTFLRCINRMNDTIDIARIEGKRLVVVDDSIVRGNTQRALVRMLREAGAAEVHVRISSPPVKWPCFYGIDFASRAELIANGLSTEEICRSIGADSLGYIGLDDLVQASTVPKNDLCRACFDGVYPIELPEEDRLGKHLLEVPAVDAARTDADGLRVSVGGSGAADSLDRP